MNTVLGHFPRSDAAPSMRLRNDILPSDRLPVVGLPACSIHHHFNRSILECSVDSIDANCPLPSCNANAFSVAAENLSFHGRRPVGERRAEDKGQRQCKGIYPGSTHHREPLLETGMSSGISWGQRRPTPISLLTKQR
jgi:hypothetical protein